MRPFLLVGLTGGIATGKSTVSAMFQALGCEVIDADRLAREVVEPGEPAYREIVREFGAEVVQADGTLDRKRLGGIVFRDARRRKRLEALTHPPIRARLVQRLRTLADAGFRGLVVFDAPVIIESGSYRAMDRLVVVYADEPTQLTRLMTRDGIARAEALRKINAQMPIAEKAKLAHYVVDNSGDRATTETQVRAVHEALLRDLTACEND